MADKTSNKPGGKRDTLKYINHLLSSDLTNYDNLLALFNLARSYEKYDFPYSHILNKIVKKKSAEASLSTGDIRFFNLNKDCYLFDALYDFDSYLIYIEWDRDPPKRFYRPRRKLMKHLVDAMQDLEDDKYDLLCLSMPPGSGKTSLGIFFLTWIMGKYPDECNLASAHGDKLTRSFFDGALNIITDPEYLWGDVFPECKVQLTNTKDQTINLNNPSRFKTLTCRPIDGALTGATRCSKYLYADDLVSGIEEALSPDRLEKLWQKYANDLKSRKKGSCKEIHIATRWSIHDVIGKLELLNEGNPRSKFIAVPALDEDGKSNFNYDYGVGFDEQYFLDMMEALDDVSFRALYMNQPIEREGLLFPSSELKYYNNVLPQGKPDMVISFCDVAWGGGDYLSMPFGYVYGKDVYIPDVIFNNSDKSITRPIVTAKIINHLPSMIRFEANNGGHEYSYIVDQNLKQMGITLNISNTHSSSKQSKLGRILQMAPEIKNVYFLEPKYWNNEYREFMKNLTGFLQTGKNKHDDAPDSMAGLMNMINRKYGTIKILDRPF